MMNTEKHIRLAALDLDGTTLRSDKSLSEYTIETLKNAHEHGMHIVVASGRSFASLPEQVIQFPWAEYAITSNGAAVYEVHTGKRLRECRLKPEVVEKLLAIAEENHVMVEGFVDGVSYSARAYVENPVLFGASLYSVSYVKSTRRPVEDIFAFLLEHKEELDSLDIVVGDERTKATLRRIISEQVEGIYLTSSVPTLLEISDEKAGKATALAFLADYLQIPQEATVAFGNAENDIDMICWAGVGVAVENSPEEVRRAADEITRTNDADGVARWIERKQLADSPI